VELSKSYGRLPLHFEANQGQAHQDVRFLSRGSGYSLYLTSREAVLVLSKGSPNEARNGLAPEQLDVPVQRESVALRMSLVGARAKPTVSGLEELPGKANYFIGNDPAKWRANVPTYAKVHYREVYPGIDLVYYGNQRQLEYDFVVAPGANPKKIVLGFNGAEKIEIDARGDLVLHASGGAIRQHKPVIYQEIDGVRRDIEGSYVRKGAKRVGFKVAAYDTSQPLIIDPVVLSYSTYLGGSGPEGGSGIAVDASGNAYVVGYTNSANFPTTAGAFQPTSTVSSNAFVTKLNPTGSALVYSTYLGGDVGEQEGVAFGTGGNGIVVDHDGHAYVTGSTSAINFPTTPGAFQPTFAGHTDAFVTKLNPTGSALIYSTYLGGSILDSGNAIALDAAGSAYVTGHTWSSNFPITAEAFQRTHGVGFVPPCEGCVDTDGFVAKLDPTGSALVYSTYLGGNHNDESLGIAVDGAGNAYVTGYTQSNNFPTTAGAFQPDFGGVDDPPCCMASDAFVAKLNSTGSALVYATYLGGTSEERGVAIAVDTDGNAYVTGWTWSKNFATTAGAFQPALRGGSDAFVSKLNSAGSTLIYSTYLGGDGGDGGSGIAVDTAGSAYVTGTTGSIDFPITAGAPQMIYGGRTDAFVTKLHATGSVLIYSTYLGGTGGDRYSPRVDAGRGIAVDVDGNAYVTGSTNSTDFPTTPGVFQPTFGGGNSSDSDDAFVAKISDATTRSEENAATYSGGWTSYGSEIGTFSGGTIVASNGIGASATFNFTGTALTWIGVKCSLCGIAIVSIDGGAPTMVNTFGPASSNLISEPVFSVSGLDPAVPHTVVITVTGVTTSLQAAPFGTHVAADAFDVTR
jgi:hypothetical protein